MRVFFSMFPLNLIERKQMQKKVKESEEHKGKKNKMTVPKLKGHQGQRIF